jgi:hypothetical protein
MGKLGMGLLPLQQTHINPQQPGSSSALQTLTDELHAAGFVHHVPGYVFKVKIIIQPSSNLLKQEIEFIKASSIFSLPYECLIRVIQQ